MPILFWITSIISVGLLLYKIIKEKNLFSIFTYTVLGIYIPLFMSFLDWSMYHVEKKGDTFFFLFVSFNVVCIISALVPSPNISKIKNIEFKRREKVLPIEIYNIIYVVCVIVENIYLSGLPFPSLIGLDVHTGRMPFIYFITTASYVVVIGDVLDFITTRRIRYLVYGAVAAVINVVSKSARIDAGIAIVQTGSFVLFYFLSQNKEKNDDTRARRKKSRLPLIIISVLLGLFLVNKGIEVGNNRMNSNGRYNTVYSTGIGYTGPETSNELLAYYYGYFALSYDNLSYNITHADTNNNFLGLNSFRCLYFGILQFDNIFGLDGGASARANEIRSKAAAVSTTFWDYYYDYDILAFFPVLLTFIIASYLARRFLKRQKAIDMINYFFWVPLWMFGSFDNRSYDYQIIWQFIILWLLHANRYVLISESNKPLVEGEHLIGRKRRKIKIGRFVI